jgi:hypothetical protein
MVQNRWKSRNRGMKGRNSRRGKGKQTGNRNPGRKKKSWS